MIHRFDLLTVEMKVIVGIELRSNYKLCNSFGRAFSKGDTTFNYDERKTTKQKKTNSTNSSIAQKILA